jgi:hyperosmotically inducible protein
MRLDKMGLRLGVALLAAVTGGLARSQPPSSTNDLKAEKQIHAALLKAADLEDNDIDVTVNHGVATLQGKVDTRSERVKAERVARVDGVTGVDNQLMVVGKKATGTASDDAVTENVRAKFLHDDTLRHTEIDVTTTNGVVILTGNVQSEDERQRATSIARRSSDVKRVEDKLQVIEASPPPLGIVPK